MPKLMLRTLSFIAEPERHFKCISLVSFSPPLVLFREKACPMLRTEMGSKGAKIYGDCAKEATGVPLARG